MTSNLPPGEIGKQLGIRRAVTAADPAWMRAATAAVVAAARELPELTADDVMARIPNTVNTREKRALGGVMLGAVVAGVIAKSQRLPINSVRANCHAKPLTVWRSLIYWRHQ